MAKKKRMSKTSKRRLALFGTLSIIVILYFIFSLGYSAYKIYSLKFEEQKLTRKLNELNKEEKTLTTDIEKLQDPEYLAKYAREAFSYSKKDEIIIQKYKDETKKEEELPKFSINDKYIISSCIIIFIIIILYILIKAYKHRKSKKKKKKK